MNLRMRYTTVRITIDVRKKSVFWRRTRHRGLVAVGEGIVRERAASFLPLPSDKITPESTRKMREEREEKKNREKTFSFSALRR